MIQVCAAIIERGGLIMSARRKPGSHLAGYWEFPGGKIEPGESPEACLARELHEEFGITAHIGAYIGESVHDYGSKVIRLLAFRVTEFDGEFQLIDHDAIQWLPPDELTAVGWAPADIPLVEQYLAQRSTQTFYAREAAAYAAETELIPVDHLYPAFTESLPARAHILDLGCGSGRDSAYFIQRGYQLTALDSSSELAAIAAAKIAQPVLVKSFTELDAIDQYDGIWANASLLHSPRGQIRETLRRLIAALKHEGVLFMSFKHGEQESTDARGRFFNNYTESTLTALLRETPGMRVNRVWEVVSPLRGQEQRWVNALITKAGATA
jgi:mutator protein MutT